MSDISRTKRQPGAGKLILIFVLFTANLILAGYFHYQNYAHHYRDQIEHKLMAVATLKTSEMVLWREMISDDGQILSENKVFADLLRRGFVDGSDTRSRQAVMDWLKSYYETHNQYDHILLLQPDGTPIFAFPAQHASLPEAIKAQLPQVVRSAQVSLVDFFHDSHDNRTALALLVPIMNNQDRHKVIAVVSMRIDPYRFLYPLIQRWPTISETAETVLCRREGDKAVTLNDLRFQKNTALNLRIQVSKTTHPTVLAVLGKTGPAVGVDYTGNQVLLYITQVPHSPWYLLSKMHDKEVYAPLQRHLLKTIATVLVLLALAAVGVLVIWRQQQQLYENSLVMAEQQTNWLYDLISRSLNEIFVFEANSLRFRFVNRGAQQNLGYAMDELASMTAFNIKPELTEQQFREMIKPLLNGSQEMLVFETVHQRKDGTQYPVEVHLQLMRSSGEPLFLAVINDITQRKQYQDELIRKSSELERFTYSMSHDLKSPLVTIKTFLGYLKEDMQAGKSDRVEQDMAYMRGAADKMGVLLDELLEYSRIGRLQNEPVTIMFGELVEEVRQLLAGPIAEGHVTLQVQETDLTIQGDRPRLVEVWQNLIENAIKYRGKQLDLCIKVGVKTDHEENVFFVQDNGMGIDPRHQHKIFNLFDKLDSASEGTGVGLALVKRIVETHGGKIWVSSEGFGQGSTFYFTLAPTKVVATT